MQEWGQVDLHKAKGNKNVRKADLTKFSKTPYNKIIILELIRVNVVVFYYDEKDEKV